MNLLGFIFVGLVAGGIAQVVVPTGRKLGCAGTIVLGMVGSVLGGLIGSIIADDGLELHRSGWIGSIVGAIVLLALVRFADRRS
jgi:uncharacterized membrane protein YeaQ/YmgE (transglycosylase-associated protein family)